MCVTQTEDRDLIVVVPTFITITFFWQDYKLHRRISVDYGGLL